MIVKLLTEHQLECLSLKRSCRGSSESTHVKMSHCWKSHALAQIAVIFISETSRELERDRAYSGSDDSGWWPASGACSR